MCANPFEGIYGLLLFLKQRQVIVPLITGHGGSNGKITLKKMSFCILEILSGM